MAADADVLLNVLLRDPASTATATAAIRRALLEEAEGLPAEQVHAPCFWSGRAAAACAAEMGGVTDKSFRVLRDLFAACSVRGTPPAVGYAISGAFAETTRGTAHVWLSSDKPSEPAGLTVGTNLWEAELPVLQMRRQAGHLAGLCFHVQRDDGTWTETAVLPDHLPIWRRHAHPLDPPTTSASFVTSEKEQHEWDAWRARPPRPLLLTWGQLRAIANKWRHMACK